MEAIDTTVRAGDIDVACTIVGEGAPLLVLHGAVGLGSTYMRALDPWGDAMQLVHYDQRGSGHTPVGDVRRVSFAGGVQDLEEVRSGLGLKRVRVLGHSAGAYLAALYAAAHPRSTAAVVLLNPGPPLLPELMQRFGEAMSSRRTQDDDNARKAIEESAEFAAGQPEALERHQLNTFIPFFREPSMVEQVSLGFTDITAANVVEAPQRMMRSLRDLDVFARLAGIETPTLVVHSERDPLPFEWSQALAAAIPGADLTVLEGGSHFPMIEDAEQLRAIVVPWLDLT